MSWHSPAIDTAHAMYQPSKRAKVTACHRVIPAEVDPRAQGTREERQAWMRERQTNKRLRLTDAQRYETMLANRRPDPPRSRPSQRADDINEAEHAKHEGEYERHMVAAALKDATQRVD